MVMQRDPIAWVFFYLALLIAVTYLIVFIFGFKEDNGREEETHSKSTRDS